MGHIKVFEGRRTDIPMFGAADRLEKEGYILLYQYVSRGGGMANAIWVKPGVPKGQRVQFVQDVLKEFRHAAAPYAYRQDARLTVLVDPGKAGWVIGKKGKFAKMLSKCVGEFVEIREREVAVYDHRGSLIIERDEQSEIIRSAYYNVYHSVFSDDGGIVIAENREIDGLLLLYHHVVQAGETASREGALAAAGLNRSLLKPDLSGQYAVYYPYNPSCIAVPKEGFEEAYRKIASSEDFEYDGGIIFPKSDWHRVGQLTPPNSLKEKREVR